jgi:phage terminase large subunit-like protein
MTQPLTATLADIQAAILYQQRHKIRQYYPERGPLCRQAYPKHQEFFTAGAKYKERLFMAANRVGKTTCGAYEATCHATGIYPPWWTGRRFPTANEGWAVGTTSETTRDIVQRELLGAPGSIGTGMIPAELIVATTARRGIADSIETIYVKHVSGKNSTIALKTYEQGRKSFEGTAKHWIWDDEEPPLDVYTEQLYRTATTNGITWITFTPLQGMSDVVKSFIEPENAVSREYKWHIQAGWKDAPHLGESEKRALIATTPPYQVQARTEGEPSLGVGAIYPIAESDVTCDLFPIPDTWRRAYGMDVGWNRTAVVWGAQDPGSGVIYLYDEHYQGEGAAPVHAHGIRSRGEWIPGAIDPASRGRSQADGQQLLQNYRDLGLILTPADNAVESGISTVWTLMVSGRLKIMAAKCQHLMLEFRKYHRDDKGRVAKTDDHLMDAMKYLIATGRDIMRAKPIPQAQRSHGHVTAGTWMGR